MICSYCKSSDVERRGTREKDGEAYARLKCKACGKWSKQPLTYAEEPTFERTDDELEELLDSEVYIVTSAQNNTPLDQRFWACLLLYAHYLDAQILVVPLLYRNPTSPGELESQDAWWPPEVVPYLIENDVYIGPQIRVMGDAKINATALNPLTGFEAITGGDSAIFGHAQIQMKTVATPQNKIPKIMHTTGSTSKKNYSKSKAGKKGDFHHSLGAVIVEVDKEYDVFHMRGVVGDSKSEFYDIDMHITPKSVKKVNAIEAIVLGDEHVIENCPDVYRATFEGPSSIVETCRPKYIVRHDVIDSYSVSHHHRQSPSIRYKKNLNGTDRLKDELAATAAFIEASTPSFSTSVIVPSNHHQHITKWLEEVDWKLEPWNARLYHELWAEWLAHIDNGQPFHPFTWWMQQNCNANVIYLQDDYPFIVKDIYLGYHGDRGPNGARGNINSFSKIGAKTVTGHTHSPGIEKGAYQVGTSSKLNLEYTSGPSSWLNTHCLIHPNGKRQMINILWGDWRLEANND